MNFEKKLHQIVNQPSFQKKSELKEVLMHSQKLHNRFSFARPSFWFRFSLKYKLIFKFALGEYMFLFAKKSAAFSLAAILLFSFVFTPFLSTNKYVNTSEYLLSALSGDVYVMRGSEEMKIDSNLELLESDNIIVASNSIAELRVMDSAVLRFGQNSNVTLGNYSKTPFLNTVNIVMSNGTVWLNSKFKNLVPTKIKLNTSQMQFDVFKDSNVVIKSNSNSLLAHNFNKPVAYTYQDNKFVVPKLSKVSLNSNKRSSIFESNFLSFVDVNKKLDKSIDFKIDSKINSNKHIAGLIPGDFMYPLDALNKWVTKLVSVDDVKFEMNHLPEKIAEVNLTAKNDKVSLRKLRHDIDSVSNIVKSNSKSAPELPAKMIKELDSVEHSLDSNDSPEVYFEIKSMISKAKINLADSAKEKSNIAIESTNDILNELADVDVETRKIILPKLLDELNVVLENVDKNSWQTAGSNGTFVNDTKFESVLEETIVMTETLDNEIVIEKEIVDKVSELKDNLEDLAKNTYLEDFELSSVSSSIEFTNDSELEITQIEEKIEVIEEVDEQKNQPDSEVDLDNVEIPESVDAAETFEMSEDSIILDNFSEMQN
jgi:hypothetical protein